MLLALLLTPALVSAASLSLPDIEAAPGETVRIPVSIASVSPDTILSLNLELRFDAVLLPPASVTADRRGSLTSSWSLAANARQVPEGAANEGQVLVAGATASSSVTVDGTLLFIDISVPQSATIGAVTSLTFASALLNNGEPTVTTIDGSLTIVGPRLRADFSGHPLDGPAPLEVRFEDLSSEGVSGWAWDFGDGATATDTSPTHIYTAPGNYAVSLTVTGAAGSDTEVKTDYIRVAPDQQPPTIVEGPVARGISHEGADLFWRTDEEGDSETVYCGLSLRPRTGSVDELFADLQTSEGIDEDAVASRLERGSLSVFDRIDCGRTADENLQTTHNVRLSGLSAATFYVYRVRSRDAAGNASGWKGGFFVTRLRPDDVPPRIVRGPVAILGPERVQIRWWTDEPGNSFVSIADNPAFADDERIVVDELVTDHQVWVDVEPGATYYARVRSSDAAGNSSTLKSLSFRTPAQDDDDPVLLGDPVVTQRSATQAVIYVRAQEPVRLRVEVGLTEDYGASVRSEDYAREHSVQLSNLTARTLYHFRVVATDVAGNSVSSDDFSFVTRGTADTAPPRFVLEPYLLKAFHDRVLIAWEASEEARALIEYGPDGDFGGLLEVAEARRRQQVILAGLSPGTQYSCRVLLTDLAGNGPTRSRTFEFRTARIIDSEAPVLIGRPRIERRSATQLTIEWDTDEASDSQVEFGLAPDDLRWQVGDDDEVTEHKLTLAHLEHATTYYLRASSADAEGNTVTSEIVSGTTRGTNPTDPLRFISRPDIVARAATSVIVEWVTDLPATSIVEYGETVSFDRETVRLERDRRHRVVLTGLTPATTYYLQASSSDGDDSRLISSRVLAVTTRSQEDDVPPRLRYVRLARTTSGSALLTWRTDEPAGGWVDIGDRDGDFDRTFGAASLERNHEVLITGLRANTTYHYRVRAADAAGNETVSQGGTLRTSGSRDERPPRVVRGPTVVASHATATFVWSTDEPCFAAVAVGTETSLGTADEELFSGGRADTEHRVTVTGLRPGIRYLFALLSTDLAGNESAYGDRRRGAGKVVRPLGESGTISFTTDLTADETAPVFTSSPRELSRGDTEVLIGWDTDEVSDSRLYLVEGNGAEVLAEFVPEHGFAHQLLLGGLQPATTYTVVAASSDPVGNGPRRSAPFTFTTAARGDDRAPALLTQPSTVATSDDAVTLFWSTDEASRAVVRYGIGSDLSAWATAEPSLEQVVELSGLQPAASYSYRVEVADGDGNTASTATRSFVTRATPDVDPPTWTREPSVTATSTAAQVIWETNEGADAYVRFGASPEALERSLGTSRIGRQHTVALTGLTPATTYYYEVSSADPWGNGPAVSSVSSFVTPATLAAPAAPTGLTAGLGAYGRVRLGWSPGAFAAGWYIERSLNGTAFTRVAGPVSLPGYTDESVLRSATYAYRIVAVGADGVESPPSALRTLSVSTTPGDYDGSGSVDLVDFFVLVDHYGSRRGNAAFEARFDLDGDDTVGLSDFFLFVEVFGLRYGSARPQLDARAAEVNVDLEVEARDGEYLVRFHSPPAGAWGLDLEYDAAALRYAGTEAATSPVGVVRDEPGRLVLVGFAPTDETDPRLPTVRFAPEAEAGPGVVRLAMAGGQQRASDGSAIWWRAAAGTGITLLPQSAVLLPNVPNPFNPSTQLRFELPSAQPVRLSVYDALGQRVAELLTGQMWSAGLHEIAWDGRAGNGRTVASGVYFSVLETPQTRRVGKLLLLR